MKEFIALIAGGGIVTAAIVWLAKSIITKAIDAGGEIFKNRLEKELEVHKKNLDMMKIQYQIQFSSLHEKRGEVIIELYSLLYDLEQDLKYYTSKAQGSEWVSDTKRDDKAKNTLVKTKEVFEKNRIFFEEDLCDKLDKIIKERENVIKKMRGARITAKNLAEGPWLELDGTELPRNIWFKQEEKVRGEIVDSRKQLADDFRVLFGIEIKSQKKENN